MRKIHLIFYVLTISMSSVRGMTVRSLPASPSLEPLVFSSIADASSVVGHLLAISNQVAPAADLMPPPAAAGSLFAAFPVWGGRRRRV